MPYNPPVRNPTKTITWLALVSQADPEVGQSRYRELERYESTNIPARYVNPNTRGVYSRLSSTYAVGQPYGAADPLITAALAPTAGNAVPGLFEGIDDGRGWA